MAKQKQINLKANVGTADLLVEPMEQDRHCHWQPCEERHHFTDRVGI